MTDLYVRRGETSNVRKRITILVILVVALAAIGFGIQRSCSSSKTLDLDDSELPELLTVEDTLGTDLLLKTGSNGKSGSAAPETSPKTRPAPAAATFTPSQSTEGAAASEAVDGTPAESPAAEATPSVAKPRPRPTSGADTGSQLKQAAELEAEGALSQSRDLYLQVFESSTDPKARTVAMDKLGTIGTELLLSPRPMTEKAEYTVQSGDSLAKLAKKFGTTVELIKASNNIRGSMIRIGDRLRVFSGTFSLKIDKSDNLLDLYLNDRFFKRYRVGTGEYNKTPVGDFKISDRIAQPTWWRPDGKAIPFGDPENELGTHWLSLDIRGYGIHGTWEPDSIGKQASAGCVRLINEEIEELYSILPVGSLVTITD